MNPPNRNPAEGGRDVKDDYTSAGACPVDRQLFDAARIAELRKAGGK